MFGKSEARSLPNIQDFKKQELRCERLYFLKGWPSPCLLVDAALVRTSAKETFVRRVCKNITGLLQRNTQQPLCCTLSLALLSYIPWSGGFITNAASVTQNIYSEHIFDLKCECTVQKCGASHFPCLHAVVLNPSCSPVSPASGSCYSVLPFYTVQNSNLKVTLWAVFTLDTFNLHF